MALTDSTASGSPGWLDALGNFADRAGQIYTTIQQGRAEVINAKANANGTTARDPSADPRPGYGPGSLPWYRAAWVMPAALGVAILAAVLVFARRRK